MKTTFKYFLTLEFKRLFFSYKKWIILGLLLFLSVYLVYVGASQYQDMVTKKDEFIELEKKKVAQIENYLQYGMYGLRLYLMPEPVSALFFNSSHFTELTCRIDSGEKLNIYRLFKGNKIFEEKPGKMFDFSGIILILGSFISLMYGFDAFRHHEYIKSLSSVYGRQQTFTYIWLARALILAFVFIVLTVVAVGILGVRGINLLGSQEILYLFIYLFVMILIQLFLFSIGTLAGCIGSRMWGGLILAAGWIFSVYFIPAAFNKVVEKQSSALLPLYKHEFQKLQALMDFERSEKEKEKEYKKFYPQYMLLNSLYSEIKVTVKNQSSLWKRVENEKSKFPDGYQILEEIENYRDDKLDFQGIANKIYARLNELRQSLQANSKAKGAFEYIGENGIFSTGIENPEIKLKTDMNSSVSFFHKLFSFFPSTFYLSTGNEISSRGYVNVIAFYNYAIALKRQFLEFFVDKAYTNRTQNVVDFISTLKTKHANIFPARVQLPGYFGLGIIVSVFWILALILLSYYVYKRMLSSIKFKDYIPDLNELEFEVNDGKALVILSSYKITMGNHFYNVLSGKNRKFKGKVVYNGIDLVKESSKTDFVFLGQPGRLPGDIKLKYFFKFIAASFGLSKEEKENLKTKLNIDVEGKKEFIDLNEATRARIMLNTLLLKKKRSVFMFHDFAKGIPEVSSELIQKVETLKTNGAAVIYITNDFFLGRKIGDYVTVLKSDKSLLSVNF